MSVTIRNSHTGFRLVPTSMPLKYLERRNSPYFAFFHRIRQIFRPIISQWLKMDLQCESKKVAPLKLFAIFSLAVNPCSGKLSWLLPKHITIFTLILVHLSEYLYELYHFFWKDPSNFNGSISFITRFMNFSLKTVRSNDI